MFKVDSRYLEKYDDYDTHTHTTHTHIYIYMYNILCAFGFNLKKNLMNDGSNNAQNKEIKSEICVT